MIRKERILLAVMAVGLSLLLILRDVFGVEISKFIYLGYTVAFLAIAQYRTMVYMICFILPLVCGLPGTYIMPCALALLFIKRGHANLWQIGMLLFVAVMEVFASFWYPTFSIPAIVQYVSFAGVMFFLIHDKTELDYLQCVKMYMFGVNVLCAVIITTGLMTAPSDWLDLFAKGAFRFGETQMEELIGMKLALNANSLAYYSITGMCCGILLTGKAKGKERLLYFALTVLTTVAGFLTVSRSWLLVAAICLFLYILSKVRNPKRFMALIFVMAVMLVGAYLLFGGTTEFLEAFVTRLNDDTTKTGGGRIEVFMEYMDILLSDGRIFFFGTGVTQYRVFLEQATSMHNGTQQILICCGLIGFVSYVIVLGKPVFDLHKTGKREMVYWLPLIGVVLFVQTIQFLGPPMLMLPYIIAVYATKVSSSQQAVARN